MNDFMNGLKTEYVRDEIGKCESVDDIIQNIFPMIATQKEAWKVKIGELFEKSELTKKAFAAKCKVSRPTLDDWLHNGVLPRDREKFIRIALVSGLDKDETDKLLQRYGRYPELYSKSLEDCICIYVLNKYPTELLEKYDYILERIREKIGNDSLGRSEWNISTVRLDKQVSEIRSDDELEKFIEENADVFSGAYEKLYRYVMACIRSNYLDRTETNNIHEIAIIQNWSSSLVQCVSAIRQRKWYPTRNKIISLGLHLSLDHDQIDNMLTLAHMEPLCAKNHFESVIMFILDDASLNDITNTESESFDPDELCDYAREVLGQVDIPEIQAFLSEIAEIDDEK